MRNQGSGKKITSLCIAMALLLALMAPAAAAQGAVPLGDGGLPLITVQGLNAVPLMEGDTQVFAPTMPGVLGGAARALPGLLFRGLPGMRRELSLAPVAQSFVPLGEALLGPLRVDVNFNRVDGGPALTAGNFSRSLYYYDAHRRGRASGYGYEWARAYGWDHVYTFTYDWRRCVFELASELNALILQAREESGQNRVNIAAKSMGAAVTNVWLAEYGRQNNFAHVENIVYLSPAWAGAGLMGALITGDVVLNLDNLQLQLEDAGIPSAALSPAINLLRRTGLQYVVEHLAPYVMDIYLRDVVRYWPGAWALVPHADFQRARELHFPGGGTPEQQDFLARLDRYHAIQGGKQALIQSLQAAGRGFAAVSLYGVPLNTPITRGENTLWADGIIETYLTGGFPTLAPLPNFEPLTAQAVDRGHNHLSPDGVVDASTAIFPDNTWFIRGPEHSTFRPGEWPSLLALWLLQGGAKATVHCDPAFPQFSVWEP